MNKPSHYETKGKQEILFGNSTLGGIVLITVLFLLNAALILSVDNFLIHNIPRDAEGRPVLEHQIPGEIMDTHFIDTGLLILYETENEELKIAKATRNTMYRYRLDLEVATITEELHIQDGPLLDFTVEGREITKASQISLLQPRSEAGVIIALCFLITALERTLFQKLRGN